LDRIINKVEKFAAKHGLKPMGIQFGNTGKGIRPNYQIIFSNDTRQAFHNGGKIFRRLGYEFNPNRLDPEESWDSFMNRVLNGK